MMTTSFAQLWVSCSVVLSCLLVTCGANQGEWSKWSVCSQTCDGGVQKRNRTCVGCVQSRMCNDLPCIGSTSMIWVVVGVSSSVISIILFALVWIFFVKEASESKRPRSSFLEITPGMSRRTPTIDSNVDMKLSVMRRDRELKGVSPNTKQQDINC